MLSPSFGPSTSTAPGLAPAAVNPLAATTTSTLPVMAAMSSLGSIPVPNFGAMLGTGLKVFGALGILSFLKQLTEGRK